MRGALQFLLRTKDVNLLGDGTFNNGTSDWVLGQTGGTPSFTVVGGVGRITLPDSGFGGYAKACPTVIGRTYRATGRLPGTTGSVSVYMFRKSDNLACSVNVVNLKSGAGNIDATFTATANLTYFT